MHDVLHPREVGVARRRDAIPPAPVVRQPLAAPVRDVERRIGEDEVRSQIGVPVVVEGVAVCDLALDAADGEVHPGEPPRGVVGLLAVDRDVAPRPAAVPVAGGVRADELHRLHEHPRRAAAGVVDPAPPGLQHLDQELHHAARGVELTALLALGARELREEVLVDAAEHVLGPGVRVAHPDVADHVDELAEPLLVERRAGVVLGQHVLERRIVALDGGHRVVHEPADVGLTGLRLETAPARLQRHPEDVLGPVLVRVLRVGALVPLGLEQGVHLLEGVGDVLQEDEAEDDVLVLGRVHRAAERIGHAPKLGLVAGRGALSLGLRARGCPPRVAASPDEPSPSFARGPSLFDSTAWPDETRDDVRLLPAGIVQAERPTQLLQAIPGES